MLLQSAGNTKTLCICPKKNFSFSHYAIFEQQYSRTGSHPSGRLLHTQTGKAVVQSPLPMDRKFLPLFDSILHQGCGPTHPPRPYPPPPPWGGVGTWGQIAQNQSNPPTHRPQTHPPPPPPGGRVGPTLSKGLLPGCRALLQQPIFLPSCLRAIHPMPFLGSLLCLKYALTRFCFEEWMALLSFA